mmetsp:Transcript_44360/g.105714  ORF Transcript_44360/g.105714 Transcript_44360/m.105714 type:complete len:246 (+) Transcript_44360:673-1410(+)
MERRTRRGWQRRKPSRRASGRSLPRRRRTSRCCRAIWRARRSPRGRRGRRRRRRCRWHPRNPRRQRVLLSGRISRAPRRTLRRCGRSSSRRGRRLMSPESTFRSSRSRWGRVRGFRRSWRRLRRTSRFCRRTWRRCRTSRATARKTPPSSPRPKPRRSASQRSWLRRRRTSRFFRGIWRVRRWRRGRRASRRRLLSRWRRRNPRPRMGRRSGKISKTLGRMSRRCGKSFWWRGRTLIPPRHTPRR